MSNAPKAEDPRNPAMTAVLVLTLIVLFVGGCLTISLVLEEDSALTQWLTGFVREHVPTEEGPGPAPDATVDPGTPTPGEGSGS